MKNSPEPEAAARVNAGPPVGAMRIGQHLLAGLLVVIGVVRAWTLGESPALVLAAAGAFTLAYWYPVLTGRPQNLVTRPWLAILALVWVATAVVSPEFIWLAFLLWLLAGQAFSLRGAIAFSVLVFAGVILAPLVHHDTVSYAAVLGPLVGGVFALGISRGYLALLRDAEQRQGLITALQQASNDLADLQDELALTQRHAGMVAERARLARDIHDTIAQDLSSIRLLSRAGKDGPDEALTQIESLAAEASREAREIIAALTPSELTDQALPAALSRLAQRFGSAPPIELQLDPVPALSPEAEVALLRTAQSALSNVRQHAAASRVAVSLSTAGTSVRLDVRDDGVGFDPASPRGYGLRFMHERLAELGGGLDVEATPGKGTALSAHVPISKVEL